MNNRSIVYIDGFNLYYGMLTGTKFKWLDLQRLFETMRQGDDVQSIQYFTARVTGPTQMNQLVYLRALSTCSKVTIIQGRFKAKQVKCRHAQCTYHGDRFFSSTEEKRTDVNIAVSMLDDAYQNKADRFILVSGDSDLVPSLAMIKRRFPNKELIVYVPALNPDRAAAVELRGIADKDRTLPMAIVKRMQFPDTIVDAQGQEIQKPADWR